MTGKRVLKWLTSLDENSIETPKTIEFINTYGHVDCMYELKHVVELAQSRSKKWWNLDQLAFPTQLKKIKEKEKPRKFVNQC